MGRHHLSTERFAADWRAKRRGGAIPQRRDLDPALFGALAPQLFMLGTAEDGVEVFGLAGALLADLHGRDFVQTPFARLWARNNRETAAEALACARRNAAPVVLSAVAAPVDGEPVGVEVTLAPVLGPSGSADRTFGLYQPTAALTRLRGHTVGGLRLLAVEALVEPTTAHLRLVAVGGRRVA